jgi:hypothetical protein
MLGYQVVYEEVDVVLEKPGISANRSEERLAQPSWVASAMR